LVIAVLPNGTLEFVYHDEFVDLLREGDADVDRASRIEPWGKNGGKWYAEIFGGPTLGPFDLRGEALAAEVDWIERNRLGKES
jgi:hypothetical protein